MYFWTATGVHWIQCARTCTLKFSAVFTSEIQFIFMYSGTAGCICMIIVLYCSRNIFLPLHA